MIDAYMREHNHVMISRIGEPAMYEMLAEECSELAHAALKTARILRKENPTPVSYMDAKRNVIEEYTDIVQCCRELNLEPNSIQIQQKKLRFLKRWDEFQQEKETDIL